MKWLEVKNGSMVRWDLISEVFIENIWDSGRDKYTYTSNIRMMNGTEYRFLNTHPDIDREILRKAHANALVILEGHFEHCDHVDSISITPMALKLIK